MPKPYSKPNADFVRCNEQIRIREVRVILNGENLGVLPTPQALEKAREHGLDLVEVAPNVRPPVCQIMDYGKFMFDKRKSKKKQTFQREKEISFRYVISDHDLQTKANQAKKFLEKGQRVKLIVTFKQREHAHKDKGFEVMKKIIEMLAEVAELEKPPGFEGNQVTARLDKKK